MDMYLISIFLSIFVLRQAWSQLYPNSTIRCDVIVAGGSTAALGAAIAAARKGKEVGQIICLTEPTEWLGGQLTASGVSAVDFGKYNRLRWFQSKTFQSMMDSLGSGNQGNCWVSTKCFLPSDLVQGWINQTVSALTNLKVFYNTVLKSVSTSKNVITKFTAIQRTPKPYFNQWALPLSQTINDWYSTSDSQYYSKQIIVFEGGAVGQRPVVIEATENGEVLILSKSYFRQGVETPTENSPTLEKCGQSITFPFYIAYKKIHARKESKRFLLNHDNQKFSLDGRPWGQIWSYRRVKATHGIGYHVAHNGEISNQNWATGNDYRDEYIFPMVSEVMSQLNDWKGGYKLDTLRNAETRSLGWFDFYKNNAPNDVKNYLSLGYDISGTSTGLSMVPYLRDTRRGFGINGFVLKKSDLGTPESLSDHTDIYNTSYPHPLSSSQYSIRFNDSIAIGDYLYADVHGLADCEWPSYMTNNKILPYHIPFRALTNENFDNLLVAGKTMSQTFFANAETRLHPVEFVTGEAAGTAASMMATGQISSRQMFEKIRALQLELEKFMPIYWDRPRYEI